MKIYCVPLAKTPSSGKAYFAHRLCKELRALGVKTFAEPHPKCDLTLGISSRNPPAVGKYILRLDGLYYDTKLDSRNKGIAAAVKKADAIIFQSQFSKKLVTKYVGYMGVKIKVPTTIIRNGASLGFYNNLKPVKKPHKYQVLTANRWRPHKRMKFSIRSTLDIKDMDVGIWVAGQCKHPIEDPRVHYLGKLDQKILGKYMKSADLLVHLCPYDNCPNTVVESIAAGTPVLCINSGGAPELVGDTNGVVCPADTPFDFKPIRANATRPLNLSKVSSCMREMLLNPIQPDRDSVNIKRTAKQYLAFFKKIIGR